MKFLFLTAFMFNGDINVLLKFLFFTKYGFILHAYGIIIKIFRKF